MGDRWTARSILQLIGWGCIFTAFVLIFPTIGQGSGASHEPGSDTIRGLVFQSSFGLAMLIMIGLGVIVLVVSAFVRSSADR